jgi:hypothetical protein
VDRVRYSEVGLKLAHSPAPFRALEDAAVDEAGEQLFEEEGISLCALEEDVAESRRQLDPEDTEEHGGGVLGAERLQRERRRVAMTATPRGSAGEELGTGGGDEE